MRKVRPPHVNYDINIVTTVEMRRWLWCREINTAEVVDHIVVVDYGRERFSVMEERKAVINNSWCQCTIRAISGHQA